MMKLWGGMSKEDILNQIRTGNIKVRDSYRIVTSGVFPEKVWEGNPTHWVDKQYLLKVTLPKIQKLSGRRVKIQKRRCISIPTEPGFHIDVKETIFIDDDWVDYVP